MTKNLPRRSVGKLVLLLFSIILFDLRASAQVSFTMTGYTPNGCGPQNITFTASATGATSYIWDFNDGSGTSTGSNVTSHIYHGGMFNVHLMAFNAGAKIGDAFQSISINGLQGNIQSTTDSACIGEPIDFEIYPQINNGTWYFGDGAFTTQSYPSHAYSTAGTYTVKLKAASQSCPMDSLMKTIVVSNSAIPSASFWFGTSTVCPNDPVQFDMRDRNVSNISWNFGDPGSGANNTSTSNSPTHVYTTLGKYAVKLTVTNSCGKSSSRTDTVYVSTSPYFNRNPYNNGPGYGIYHDQGSNNFTGCPGDVFNIYTTVNAVAYKWKFGNGDSSTVARPVYSYNTNGTYNLSLKLTNGCGIDTILYTSVKIGSSPYFGGNPYINANSTSCPNDKISFSAYPQGTAYLWNFGDGTTSTLSSPSHSYTTTGTKNVYLQLTNSCGKDTIIFKTITISNSIVPVLSQSGNNSNWGVLTNNVCPGDTVSAFVFGGASYIFDFGDGTSTTQTTPLVLPFGTVDIAKHAYTALGTYKFKVTYFNGCGNSAKDSINVTVGNNVPVSGGINIATQGNNPNTCDPIDFIGAGGNSYKWYFGNGDSIITNKSFVKYAYPVAGTYTVTLKVSNSCGNKATYTQSITINSAPSPVITQVGDTLIAPSASSYQWMLNGTNVVGATSRKYIPVMSGSYTVKVTNANGCSLTSNAYLDCFVKAGLDVTICPSSSVQLNATGATSYSWSPSTGLSSTVIANPTASPASTQSYIVTGTTSGCPSKKDTVVVNVGTLVANAGPDKSTCSGTGVTLNGSGGASYSWSPTTGLSNPLIANPIANPTGTTTYTLTVTSGSCTSTDVVIVNVTNAPTANAGADQTVCANNSIVTLNGTKSNAASILWTSTGTGSFSNASSLTSTYTPSSSDKAAGSVTLTLTATGNSPCGNVSDQMVITITPAPTVNAGAALTVCANNASVNLVGTVTVATGGIWSGGSGTFGNASALNTTYTPSAADKSAGSVTLTLTSSGNGNCTAVTSTKVITISPAPTVNAGAAQSVCANNANVTLSGTLTVATGGTWTSSGNGTFGNANSLSTTYTPSASDISAGTVTLTLTTTTGNGNCTAVSGTKVITITPAPAVNAGAAQSVCGNNANVSLSGTVSVTNAGNWTSSGSGTFGNASSLITTYTPSAGDISTGSVTLTLTSSGNGNCNAVTGTKVITITPAPTVSAGPAQSVCANNAAVTLTGTETVATGGTWTTTGTGTFGNANALSTTYTPSSSDKSGGSITFILTTSGNGNCNAVTSTKVLTITAAPTINAGAAQSVCANNANVSLSGTVTVATGGNWTSSGNGTFGNASLLNTTYTPSASDISGGTVTLTLTSSGNGNCTAVSATKVITITPAPTVNAGSAQSVCGNNANVSLSGALTVATGGTWTTSGNGTFANPSALSTTYTPSATDISGGSVTLTLTSTTGNGNCNAVTGTKVITITPAPTINAGAAQTVCANNATVTLAGSETIATSGTWTSTGSGTFANANALSTTYTPSATDKSAGSVTLTLTSGGNGNCSAVNSQMVVTITPIATVANAGVDQNICSSTSSLTGNTPTVGSGVWTVSSGPGLVTTASDPISAVTNITGTTTFTWTVSNTCSTTSDNVTITVSANAAAVVSITSDAVNNAVCQGSSVTFTALPVNGGTPSYQWMQNGANAGTNSATFTPSSIANNDQVSVVMTSSLGCATGSPATSNTITVTVNATPTVANAGADQNVSITNATLAGNTPSVGTGTWTVVAGTGVFTDPSSPTTTVSGLSTGVNVFRWTITNGACSGTFDDVNVTLTPTGIISYTTASSYSVYPNPFTEELNLKFNSFVNGKCTIKITDLNGKVIDNFEHDGSSDLKLGNNLNTGVYCIQVIYENHIEVIRVIKL